MLILVLVIVIILLYLLGIEKYTYWREKGVRHDNPIPLLGNNARNIFMQKSLTQLADEVYWKYPNEKVVGFYRMSVPELVIRDPVIAKRILMTDFAYFYPRGLLSRKVMVQPLLRNPFFVDGDAWKLLRQRLTPAFSSGKLRAMFPLITERAQKLQARVLKTAISQHPLDARDIMGRYTSDFIGACGFGLDVDSLNDDYSEFRQLAAEIFNVGLKKKIMIQLRRFFPRIFKHIKTLSQVEKGITELVREVLRQRNYEMSQRNDFIDLLLECKNKGTMVGESIEKPWQDGKPQMTTLEMDDSLLAAQVFIFLAAGFETSSSAASTTLNELAHNPQIQSKVQQEIDRVLAKHDNKLCYEAIKDMTYLGWTFKESMRVFPPLGYLIRECARQYTFEDINLTVDKGVRIFIPLQALHNDPQYFDNPTEFRPERFDPTEFNENLKHVYMPFGSGPRTCIGERLGLMQSLAGLVAVLSQFRVSPVPGAPRRPAVNPASTIVQAVKGGVPLIFTPRAVKLKD